MSSGRGGLRLFGLLLLAGSAGSFALGHRATDGYHALLFAAFGAVRRRAKKYSGAALVVGGVILLWHGLRRHARRGQP